MDKQDNFQKKNHLINQMGITMLKGLELQDLELLFLLDKFTTEGKKFKRWDKLRGEVRRYQKSNKDTTISMNNKSFHGRFKKLRKMGLIVHNKGIEFGGNKQGFLGFLIPNLNNLFGRPSNEQIEDFEKYSNLLQDFHRQLFGVDLKSISELKKPTLRKIRKKNPYLIKIS